MNGIFFGFGLFFLKHFVVDFPLQRWPWMFRNKGTWGHPGGVTHSFLHGIATLLCFWILLSFGMYGPFIGRMVSSPAWGVVLPAAFPFAFVEGFTHYVIDWAKMNINRIMNWRPDTDEWFWHLLGLDQLLHYTTYLVILYIWFCYG